MNILHNHSKLEDSLIRQAQIGSQMVVVDYEFGDLFENKLPFHTKEHIGPLWIVLEKDFIEKGGVNKPY